MKGAGMVEAAWLMSKQRLDRIRQRVAEAALGYGLLLLHVGVFLIAATGLLLVDLYRNPASPTVSDLLRTWAAIIVFHAVAITGYRVARWGLGLSAAENPNAQPVPAQATPLVEPTGRRLGEGLSWAQLRPNLTLADVRAFAERDVQTARTVLTSVSVQVRTMTVVYWQRLTAEDDSQHPTSTTTSPNGLSQPHVNGLAAINGHQMVDVAATGSQGNGAMASRASSWPERKPHATGTAPAPTNGNAAIHHNGGSADEARREFWQRPDPAVHSSSPAGWASPAPNGFTPPEPANGSTPIFDPLPAASIAPGDFPDSAVAGAESESARWSWMEAAAAAWLSQREGGAPPVEQQPSSQEQATPRTPAMSSAPPSEPDAAASG